MQVLFHVNEPARLSGAVRNIDNVLDEIPAISVELVVNGPAVRALVPKNDAVARLATKPAVTVAVCQNSLRRFNVEPVQLPDTMTIVASGVIELVRKQEAGFAYIKP
ncbi:DsrE family protein [Ligilactobacillus sp. LYQ139]|uniref:DsrE family protein n=1 Tax=Ligilactobacillus sp. LYQ139 TaxID=3378800 RepID=UPI00385527F6